MGEQHWVTRDDRIIHCSQEPYKPLFIRPLSPTFTQAMYKSDRNI